MRKVLLVFFLLTPACHKKENQNEVQCQQGWKGCALTSLKECIACTSNHLGAISCIEIYSGEINSEKEEK